MEQECSGVSDNPLFFPAEDEILFGGNLHGESTALVLDYMAIAATELASISERRTYQLLSGQRGLPSFLAVDPGAHSGLMVTQYTSAALLNECKVLSTPASVDTIPTCQLQEDHVSMGGTAALKLRQILDNCEYILGIELITAAQAAQLHGRLELSPCTRAVLEDLRRHVAFLDADRVMSDDIQAARRFITREAARWQRELDLA
jgi:histidine ammonia-lyase